jgi:nucleotide-binding universal stress UspA family protein
MELAVAVPAGRSTREHDNSSGGAKRGVAFRPPRSISPGISQTSDSSAPTTEALNRVAPSEPEQQAGPILIAYDGSPAAQRAPILAARLLAERRALLLVVWTRGLGRELLELPPVPGLPPGQIDIRTAQEIDQAQAEAARRLGRTGGAIARGAGLETEVLVVAEPPEIAVSETIVRVARERDCCALLIGEHAHGRVGEVFLGVVSRDVIRYAPCPVIVIRQGPSPPAPRSSQPGPNGDPIRRHSAGAATTGGGTTSP